MKSVKFIAIVAVFIFSTASAKALEVVASIKPLALIAEAVLGKDHKISSIIGGSSSPHGFRWKPSQVVDVKKSDIFIYIGDGFEGDVSSFIENKNRIEVMKLNGLNLIAQQASDHEDEHMHEDDHEHEDEHMHEDDHEHESDHEDEHEEGEDYEDEDRHMQGGAYMQEGAYDPHLWLDPHNVDLISKAIIDAVVKDLPQGSVNEINKRTKLFLANLEDYFKRAKEGFSDLSMEDYMALHSALNYYTKAVGLSVPLSVTGFDPHLSSSLGPVTLLSLRRQVKAKDIKCALVEPQFSTKAVDTIFSDISGARITQVDVLGVNLDRGAGFINLVEKVTEDIDNCLRGN